MHVRRTKQRSSPSYLLDLRNVLRMPPTSSTSIYMHCTIRKIGFKRYEKKERRLIRQSGELQFESLALLIRVKKKKNKKNKEGTEMTSARAPNFIFSSNLSSRRKILRNLFYTNYDICRHVLYIKLRDENRDGSPRKTRRFNFIFFAKTPICHRLWMTD